MKNKILLALKNKVFVSTALVLVVVLGVVGTAMPLSSSFYEAQIGTGQMRKIVVFQPGFINETQKSSHIRTDLPSNKT